MPWGLRVALALLVAIGALTASASAGGTCAVDVSSGSVFSIVVYGDGRVQSFGRNDWFQLGNGTTAKSSVPVFVEDSITGLPVEGAVASSCGVRHTLLLIDDGSVKAFGNNTFGQLGDGTTVSPSRAVDAVFSSGTKIVAVAAGAEHSLALDATGNLWTWGRNTLGALGDGTTTNRHTPAMIGLSSVTAIAGGTSHSLALLSDGEVLGWGRNREGQLGDGGVIEHRIPMPTLFKANAGSNIVSIAGADQHTTVAAADGSVWTSGDNNYGRLGQGTSMSGPNPNPLQVKGVGGAGFLSGIVEVASSGSLSEHTLARNAGGDLFAWGRNCCYQIGIGPPSFTQSTPAMVLDVTGSGQLSNVVGMSAGDIHSIATLADGSVLTWGLNSDGELGDGTTNPSGIPLSPIGLQDCRVEAPDCMTAWWPFDEMVVGTFEELVYDNTAVASGGVTPLAGEYVDDSVCFDGATGFIEVADACPLDFGTGDFTIDFWIRPNAKSGIMSVLDKREDTMGALNGWSVYLQDGAVALQMADGTHTNWVNSGALPVGQWSFVAITVERGSPEGIRFYIDGMRASIHNPMGRAGSLDNASPLRMGVRTAQVPMTRFYDGCLDEVELFKRALSAAEIEELFVAGTFGKCKDLCLADLNGDGVVDFFDLLEVLNAPSGPCGTGCCPEDLNGDCAVNFLDVLEVIYALGPCP